MDDFQPDDFAPEQTDDFVADDFHPDSTTPRVSDYVGTMARPVLEGGGAVAGGMLGAPLGPVGAAGGGVLGFATGKAAADLLDRSLGRKPLLRNLPEAARETAGNVYEGAQAEATGQVVGRAVPSMLRGVGRFGAKLGEWATAVPEKDFHVLAEHPRSILPGTMERAGQQFDDAMRNAGISSELTPEAVDRLRHPGQYAFDTFNKLKTKGAITPQEALHARQSLDAIYPVPNKKNGSYIRMLDQIRDAFQGVIASASPELKEASKEYAIAKSGSRFQSLFPKTNAGKPAFFRTGAIISAVAAGHPEAIFGIPAVAGATTAVAGPVGSMTSSILRNPATRRLLATPISQANAKLFKKPGIVGDAQNVQGNPQSENNGTPENQAANGSFNHGPSFSGGNIPLSKEKAREFLDKAKGDKDLARKLARKAGYSW